MGHFEAILPTRTEQEVKKFLDSILVKLSSYQHGLEICCATVGYGQKANV